MNDIKMTPQINLDKLDNIKDHIETVIGILILEYQNKNLLSTDDPIRNIYMRSELYAALDGLYSLRNKEI